MMPPWYWTYEVENLAATPLAANTGDLFTAAANNADGTVVAITDAGGSSLVLAADLHHIVIGFGGINTPSADGQCLVDLLQDPAGGTSWASFIDDMICGFTPTPSSGGIGINAWYRFPVWIKSGTSLAVRARTAHTADITTGRVLFYGMGSPSRPDVWWCGQKVESLGINAASSKGTNVTPGDSGTYGSWTTIGTSTYHYGAVQLGVNGSDATASALGYNWQLGYSSTKLAGSPTQFSCNNTSEVGRREYPTWIPCSVPAGTVWQARATASGVSAEVHNAAIYGVS